MSIEIERKFLIDKTHPDVIEILKGNSSSLEQGYLLSESRGVLRVRVITDINLCASAYLTFKTPSKGLSRGEFEYPISLEDAQDLIENHCYAVIKKDRYMIEHDGLIIELDVFQDLDLMIAEVELPSEDHVFDIPAWFGEDVSHDPQYFNNNLAQRARVS